MTYREALDAMIRIADADDSVCLSVDTWRYSYGGVVLTWKIWSAKHNEHYTGATPEIVLAAFAAGHPTQTGQADAFDAVGEVLL